MNWEIIGVVAEILGATGVIISLAYLALQIKAQNKESQLAAEIEMTSQWQAFLGDLAVNTQLAGVYEKGIRDLESLNPTEHVQFSTHVNRVFRSYESMYRQNRSGRLDSELWDGINNSISEFSKTAGIRAWWPSRAHWFGSGFRQHVQTLIDAPGESIIKYGFEAAESPPGKSLETDA